MDVESRRRESADRLGDLATRIARLINGHARPLLADTGIESSMMRVVGEVVTAGDRGLHPAEIAERLVTDPSTISRQVRAAVDRGLVEQVPDPDDRRSSYVQLTEHGRQAYRTVRGRRAELLAEMLAGWDEPALDQLLGLLARLETSIRA